MPVPASATAPATAPTLVPLAAAAAASQVGRTRLSWSVVPPPQTFAARPELAALGARLFFDGALSEPRGRSCASCHDPAHGFSGSGPAGVPQGSRVGHAAPRNAPSLLYIRYTPPLYLYQDDDSTAPEPRGGLFADGRHDRLADAIAAPLLHPDEMNNRDARAFANKLAATPHAKALRRLFDARVLDDPKRTLKSVGLALEAFLESDAMAPFSSRYDAFIRGQAEMTPLEARGLRLFANPDKGNCASCHVFAPGSSNPTRSLFTDYGYDALAVPRNRALAANRDPLHFDLGLCATARAKEWPDPNQWCGYFKTPSLRNVALRERYMHNGAIGSLHDAVDFYATRSTETSRWYHGTPFDDVPAALRGNVNVNSAPLNRPAGSKPALAPEEIDAIVAFLRTLSDQPLDAGRR